MKKALRLYELCDRLADVLRIHPSVVDRACRHLRDAAMLPASMSAGVDARHAAVFMIGLTAARAPTEAVEAVGTYAELPAISIRGEWADRAWHTHPIEDAIVQPGAGQAAAWFCQSFVHALTLLLRCHDGQEQLPPHTVPLSIGLRRDLLRPRAIVTMPAVPAGAPGVVRPAARRTILFGPGPNDGGRDMLDIPDSGVWFFISGTQLLEIAVPADAVDEREAADARTA